MKKLVSIILSLVIVFGMAAPFKAAANEGSDSEYSEAIDFLTSIGVVDGVDDTTIADPVSREDFAVYLANLLGVDTKLVTEQRYFTDLSMTSYGTFAVNSLVDLGVVSLSSERKFRPDDPVTLSECAKMICIATGYKHYAEANGGYPLGYVSTLRRSNVLTNVKNSEAVTFEEAAEMLYKAAQLSISEITVLGDKNKYSNKEGNTLLSLYHSIYFDEGTVTSVCGQSLSKMTADFEDMYIDGEKFSSSDRARDIEILGEYIKYFYKLDSKTDEKTVIYTIKKAKAETIKISIDDFEDYVGGKLTYYGGSDGNKKFEKSVNNPNIIYNGYPIDSEVAKMFENLNKGYIFLKDADSNGVYDTIIVNDYTNFVVNYIDKEMKVIYNKLNSLDRVDYSEFETVVLFDEDYNVLELDDINATNVLSVAKSKEGAVLMAIRSNTIFNGVLDSKNTIKDDAYVQINGKEYQIEKSYRNKFSEQTVIGQNYYYSVDFLGNIAYVDNVAEDTMNYGYIIKGAMSNEVFSGTVFLKMLTQDGAVGQYTLAERVKIDGKLYKEGSEAYGALVSVGNGQLKDILVRYILDDAGLIKEIDTPYLNIDTESDKNSLTPIYGNDFSAQYARGNRLGLKTYTNSDTLVFGMPSTSVWGDEARENEYIVNKNVGNDALYTCNVYTTNTINEYCNVVVYKYEYSNLSANNLNKAAFMVSSINSCINTEGVVVRKLCGYLSGTYYEYEIDDAINLGDIERGDLVQLHFDANNNIIPSYTTAEADVVVLYDYSKYKGGRPTDTTVWKGIVEGGPCYFATGAASYGGYYARMQLSFGYANSKVGNMIKIGYTSGENFDEIFDTKAVKVTVFDKSLRGDEQVYVGTIDDILDYESTGNECSSVIIHTRDCDPKSLIVYK